MSEYLDDFIKDLAKEALASRQMTPETLGPYGLSAEISLHYLIEEPEKLRQLITKGIDKSVSYDVRPFLKDISGPNRIIYGFSVQKDSTALPDEWGVTTNNNPPDAPWHATRGTLLFIPDRKR